MEIRENMKKIFKNKFLQIPSPRTSLCLDFLLLAISTFSHKVLHRWALTL